ncbi:hypothetical protein Poly41_34580 [Novipirellula artificiosorum]|uniref:Uncharacterized protein n=1 Tax=Novipirellula artificiosorum TaxID=2528016 RepID=A0A5C6DKN5_9BACT|nr:hypothetical protein Poly41_34580 [Novipirellula artificiosorum]
MRTHDGGLSFQVTGTLPGWSSHGHAYLTQLPTYRILTHAVEAPARLE